MIAFSYLLVSTLLFFASPLRAAPTLHTPKGDVLDASVFESLEELARIVDIAYCVGSTGISKPFQCLSRCKDFDGFELVTTWNTGPLLSDSCGYIAISHEPFDKRVLVAFRGTYSIANTIADLSTRHAEYLPFPAENDSTVLCSDQSNYSDAKGSTWLSQLNLNRETKEPDCKSCQIHSGFLKSWQNTRCLILPHIERALAKYPDYNLVLVGHSLGGAVATIAGLELQARGYHPRITTFGEPRLGNRELNQYIDHKFNLNSTSPADALLRRVTHASDPVPLLPPEEWGYEMHAGEIYISKSPLPPAPADLRMCSGDADPSCIAGGADTTASKPGNQGVISPTWGISDRYRLWELFFAHRDYFWRLGLCMPGGDPWDWNRHSPVESPENQDDNDDHEL